MHADRVRQLRRSGLNKSEIARRLNIGRTSVRRILMKGLDDELLDYGTQMTKRHPRSQPTWTDVKAKLADLDRTKLNGLFRIFYAAHKDNQTFLHTRFGLGEDVLKPTRKPWSAGSGRMCCVTRIFRLQRPNRPFPVTERRLANLPDSQS